MSFLFSQPAPGIVPIDSISFAELAKVDASSVLGNPSGSLADASSITFTNLTSLLDPFAGTLQGLVPASSNTGTLFLRDDGTWVAAGGGLPTPTIPTDAAKVVAVDSSGVASWQYAGLGDGSFPANTVILGQAKPASLVGADNFLAGASAGVNSSTAYGNIIIGTNAGAGQTTSAAGCFDNVIIGNNANAANRFGVVIGKSATGSIYSVSIGASSSGGNNAVAIGAGAVANGGVAIGESAKSSGGSVSIGYYGGYLTGSSDFVAVGQTTKAYANGCVTIGKDSWVAGVNGIAIGLQTSVGTGTGQIIIGASSGRDTAGATGSNNTVVGSSSFNSASLTTAANNTILGQGSATALTTGSNNIVLGKANGTTLTTGSNNVLIGNGSGTAARDGIIAIGDTVALSQTGDYGVFLGQYCGAYGNGNASIAIGYRAASSLSNSSSPWSNSIYLGNHAGYSAGIGSIGIGYQATANSFDDYVIAIGYSALQSGDWQNPNDYTVAIGYQAGYEARAQNSVLLGRFAGSRAGAGGLVQQKFYLNGTTTRPATEQAEKDAALMYGEFNNTPSSQTLSLNAQVNLAYGERHAVATKTATPISVAASDYTIAVDTATIAGASAVNLPVVSAADKGRVYVIKDLTGSAATNNITINVFGGSGNLIDGASSQTISVAYGSLTLQSDGSNRWMIL